MAKRRFNDKWLEKQDPNNQLVSLWCSKKNDYTAACSFCKADISVDHMGFGSLKQHANGSKHKQLAGVSNISQEGKPKHQSSLSSFFIKSDPQPVKSETPPEKCWCFRINSEELCMDTKANDYQSRNYCHPSIH